LAIFNIYFSTAKVGVVENYELMMCLKIVLIDVKVYLPKNSLQGAKKKD
jgi:hypothetical protein